MVMVFWGVKQYGLVDGYKRFGRTCCCCFYLEDGDSEFLWNVFSCLPKYTEWHPGRLWS